MQASYLCLYTPEAARPVVNISNNHLTAAMCKLDAKNTAVLFIEFQNEFTAPGGVLHDAVKGVMGSTDMLAHAKETAEQAREKGALILHAPITFSDDYRELGRKDLYGILANVKGGGCFKKSAWGGEFDASMQPAASDIVVEGKRGLCAFASTNLDFILRQNNIQNLVLAGFLTNCCVESTMRTGYELGFHVYTLTDTCAATSQEGHDAAIKHAFPMFSEPITHTEFLERLE